MRLPRRCATAPTSPNRRPNPAAAFNAGERNFLYEDAVKESSDEPRCRTCGVAMIEHLGIYGTCHRLQVALDTLRQVAELPPRCSRRATALAESCLVFLEACEQDRQKNNKQKAKLK